MPKLRVPIDPDQIGSMIQKLSLVHQRTRWMPEKAAAVFSYWTAENLMCSQRVEIENIMKTSVIEIHDMLSVLSVDEVEKRIGEVPGVGSVTVNYAAANATVRYDETRLEIADIKSAVRQRGFESAAPTSSVDNQKENKAPSKPPETHASIPIPMPMPVAPTSDADVPPDAAKADAAKTDHKKDDKKDEADPAKA